MNHLILYIVKLNIIYYNFFVTDCSVGMYGYTGGLDMLSKMSVKKPYTVVVAVVLVLILGVVSFMDMTTDLLPSMNLPYAVVITTYAGASPEEVELAVTKPIEQAMATVSNIENISSTSGENLSTVILEFSESTNMDSVSIEMRESLDQISAYWSDSVGNPIIMKLNPDMLPIMISGVEVKGLEGAELTDYVEKEIVPELESIEGVASVSTSGSVKESVQVILRQEKIDKVNEKIKEHLNENFKDAEEELADAKNEMADAKKEIASGKNEINDGKAKLDESKDQALAEITDAKQQLDAGKDELLKAELEIAGKKEELERTESELKAAKEVLDKISETLDEYEDLEKAYNSMTETYNTIIALEEAQAGFDAAIEQINSRTDITDEEKAMLISAITDSDEYKSVQSGLENIDAGLSAEGYTRETYKELYEQTSAAYLQMAAQMETINATLKSMGLSIDDVDKQKKEIDKGLKQVEEGKKALADAEKKVAEGKLTAAQAAAQLTMGETTATLEMSGANAKLAASELFLESSEKQLESSEKQIESAEEELQKSKESAYKQAKLENVITLESLEKLLTAQNFTMPAGYITEEGIDYLIRVGDDAGNLDELKDMTLIDMGMDGLEPIKLIDVADVAIVNNSDKNYTKINGKDGIILSMEKQTGYSTGDVSDRIADKVEEIMGDNADINVITLMDQGIYIKLVINSVLENMIFGGFLAVIILFIFLKDIRPTLVIACSIPISIVAAIALMYFSGVTLNVISLSGLALGVGMLVDNSIVVIENIYRLRSEGFSAKKAAVEGAGQVAGAIMASTLTTACVFAPIVFTDGITKQLFVDMGLTIAYSLFASLLVALTLVPMMGAGVLKGDKEKEGKFINKLQDIYGTILSYSLKFKPIVLIAVVIALIASVFGAFSKGTAFMPEMESTQVTVSLNTETGTLLSETAAVADEAINRMLELDDVEDIGAMMDSGSLMSGNSSNTTNVTIYLILKEDKKLSGDELAKEILERTKDLNCELTVNTSSMDMSALGGSGVSVRIKGKDTDTLKNIARDIAKLVEGVDGTEEVSDGIEEVTTEFRIIVDKEKAAKYNYTVAQIYQVIRSKITEVNSTTTLSTDTKDYSVSVSDGAAKEFTREEFKDLKLDYTDKDGDKQEIAISEVVDFVDADGLSTIQRDAQERYISVSAGVDSEHNIGLVAGEVEKAISSYELPKGYTIEMIGEDETINDAMVELIKMLILAVVFMYLIMVAQFQSLLSPFIIMFTIPLAFTGGFLGLIIADAEVSVIALIGFVMLSGIIVNNGIVLVDYINQLRESGIEKHEAIILAGKTRLRPIIMTALTTILGLSTMAFGMGMGSDMVQPMAIVTVGGLIYGTLLTLLVVPCIYDILNRKEMVQHEEI